MLDCLRCNLLKLLFSTITLALLILFMIFSDGIIFNFSLHTHRSSPEDGTGTDTDTDIDSFYLSPSWDARIVNRLNPEELGIFQKSRRFDSRVKSFFSSNQCQLQIFMTWILPVDSFGKKEFAGLDSLFHSIPTACLIILSRTMDSRPGYDILEPLISRRFRVQAMSPDLWSLVSNTPTEGWLNGIRNGSTDPGKIRLAQHLSDLIRLAVLYKYGGVYLDTDFLILNDFSGLKNSLGAQSVDNNGNWKELNGAVMIFDKNHPLLFKFLEEFASNFDGNNWGQMGPYLVSRVVTRLAKTRERFNFSALPMVAFYPIDWIGIKEYFARPIDREGERRVENKIRELGSMTYGLHLWNKFSRDYKIEEGSIIWRLISHHCVICSTNFSSTS